MRLVYLENIFVNEIARAISRSFLHSLWQGLLFVFIAIIVLSFTKTSKPTVRYNFLVALFTFFVLLTGYTFLQQFGFSLAAGKKIGMNSPAIQPGNFTSTSFQILNYLDSNASQVFIFWFLVFSWKSAMLIRSLGQIRHTRRNNVFAPSEYWKNKVKQLAQLLQLQKPVLLLESSIVKLPVVIGFFKPVILVPVALLSNLSLQHAEAILLHELAHIRRRDYLINLLQSFAEAIFFFNPGLLWLSSRIREERENCCDEMAINITGDKINFVKALLSFHEYATVIKYAMAFRGKKYYLFNRVSRIVGHPGKKPAIAEKIFLFITIIIAGVFAMSFYGSTHNPGQNKNAVVKIEPQLVPPNKNKVDNIYDDSFRMQGNINVPVKFHSSPRKSFGEKASVKDKNEFVRDTIPPNASKEFIAGYMAAINFNKKNYEEPPGNDRAKTEQSLQTPNNANSYDQRNKKDAVIKKQVEEKLRKARNIQ
jgi:beta-lactamase regulating signal transducer with metallopeptidase domain